MDLAALLRERRVAQRRVFQRADAAVRELQVDADRVLRRLGGVGRLDAERLDFRHGSAADETHEVDEVAALADHAAAADGRVLDPDGLRNRPRVDAVVHHERLGPPREIVLQQLRVRTEPAVEANHDLAEPRGTCRILFVRGRFANAVDQFIELLLADAERLLGEDALARRDGRRDLRGVKVVARRHQDELRLRVVQRFGLIRRREREALLASRLAAAHAARRADAAQPRAVRLLQRRQQDGLREVPAAQERHADCLDGRGGTCR